MVFCENAEMLLLLRTHLRRRRFPFVFLDGDCRRADRTRQLARFAAPGHDAACLLTGVATSASGAAGVVSGVGHVVFYDVCPGMTTANTEKWMR